jgi:hypothetical protein
MPYTNPLPFVLPAFTRVVWANARSREVWAPRLDRIRAAWADIERWSVKDGVRPSALQSITADELIPLSGWALRNRLTMVPLEKEDHGFRVAFTNEDRTARQWKHAWEPRDHHAIGVLLGFPDCCRDFYARTCGAGQLDTMADMQAGVGPRAANILLRSIGVHLVAHLPCSFNCHATARLGHLFVETAKRHGYAEEIAWIEEMLDWPVQWSALHGIAEIVTPILKVSTRTDATADKLTVQRPGDRYPDEGATGLAFPFQRPARVIPMASLRSKPVERKAEDSALWRDNGFVSRAVMDAAHDRIITALGADPPRGTLVDLGCGNGHLMHRIAQTFGCHVIGLEANRERAERALLGVDVRLGSIADVATHVPEVVDVALVAQNRIDEGYAPAFGSWAFVTGHARRLFIYSFDEHTAPRWVKAL